VPRQSVRGLIVISLLGATAACGAQAHSDLVQPLDTATLDTTAIFTAVPTKPSLPRRFSLLAAGDVLSHTSVIEQASDDAGGAGYDFAPMFEVVRPIIEGVDVAICHLETPVAPPGTEPDGVYPTYGVPAEMVVGLRTAGFDRCSLASNHTMDKGAAGIDATLAAFDAAGLGHAGMARAPAEAAPATFDVNGVRVAHISATQDYNGLPIPNGETWRSNLIDPARIIAEAQQARAAGAEVVIVSLHWGAEGVSDVTAEQRAVANAVTASGAVDLIVGHHAHVVQPIEQINGRWVVFGMGNMLSGMGDSTDCCGPRALDGMMVRVDIAEQPDGTFVVEQPQVSPIYLARMPYRILSVSAALADPTAAWGSPASLLASLERTNSVVGAYVTPG
jgi:poly-gamma-glutamate capsule biosynthesis protein CapA/YwtB (metallophosphatase superfamily)